MILRHLPHPVLASASALLLVTSAVTAQATWHRRWPTSAPSPRYNAPIAFDETRGQALLLFGSTDQGVIPNDFWRWDGDWTQVATSLPPARRQAAMAFDARRQRLVLFGGGPNNNPPLQDLWEWDGVQWSARTPAASPSARLQHALAYDRDHGLILMFGGSAASGMQNDTWTWNGTQWNQLSPSHRPSPRNDMLMAFDPAGGVLLYGGATASGASDETWSWNGSDWVMRTPAAPPYVRGKPGMVADLHRGRVVLFGGSSSDNTTWEWDGAEWHDLVLPGASPRQALAMAYDTTRRETILFGGFDPSLGFWVNDTWTYSTPTPASYTAYGSGCAGSAGVPVLANKPYVLPWLGDSFTARASNLAPAAGAVIFATGLSSTPPQSLAAFGMPGCDALLQPAVTDLRLAAAGAADWVFAIPNMPALAGVQLFQQAFALENGANAAGIVVSNGAELVAGIR